MPHFTLPRTHSSPAKPPPPTPGASGPAPASPPKGVKRIVSGLKRRISHTFLRGHRHHASTDALDVSHPSLDDHEPLTLFVSGDQPTPISISVSPHHGPSVDTLTRGVADGGLGKHVADCSDSSDATSDYSVGSSFRGRGHRTASSGSGSFSYTSPGGLQDVTGDAAPLPEIAESPSSPEQTETPAPPASSDSAVLDVPATVDALALALSTPLPEDTESELGAEAEAETTSVLSSELPAVDSVEDKRSIESLCSRLSPEYVGAPIREEVSSEFTRERTLSLASVESLTAPLETLVLSEDVSPSAVPVDPQSDAASTHLPLPVSTSVDVPLPSAQLDVLEEPRQRKISMLSIESLTAPLEILVLPDDETSPRTSPDTEPESSPFDVSLSIPLTPSTPDSPSILPVESQQLPAPEDDFSSTLGPQPTETVELPSAQSPAGPTAPAGGDDAPVSFSWVLEYFPTELVPSELEEPAQDELEVALGDAVLPVVEQSPIPSEPFHIAPLPSSSPDLTHSAPPTPPLAASDEYGSESEEEEDFEFDPHGLTMAMPMLFLPSPKVRYPAFSSLTWWLPRGTV